MGSRGFCILAAGMALCLMMFAPSCAIAQETPAVTGPPELVTGGTGTTAPSPGEVLTAPQLPVPNNILPPPLAPSEPPTGYVAPPASPPLIEQQNDFINFSADEIRTTFRDGKPALTIAEGNVTARFRNTVTTAQSARVDYDTNLAEFDKQVVFKIDGQAIVGEHLTLNLKTRAWALRLAQTTIEPRYARGYLNAPVFANGDDIEGIGRTSVTAHNSETTTCNLEIPHYELIAKSVSFYPGRRIVLRRVTAYALGRRLFTLPILVIPLQQIQQNPNLIPRFGQSADEGFFLKTSYAIMGDSTKAGFLLLDLMSRKGIGTGLRETYNFSKASGEAQIYGLQDQTINRTTLTGHVNHLQQMGTINAKLTSDFRTNSYLYAPESQSINSSLALTRNRTGAESALVVEQGIDDAFTQTKRLNGNLTHRQIFSSDIQSDTNLLYTSFGGTSTSTTSRLTSQTMLSKREEKFDWSLSAQKLTDLSDEAFVGSGRFAGIEKLPELSLTSDTARLGKALPGGIPAQMRLSFGQFNELPLGTDLGRAYLEVNTPATRHSLTDTWSVAAGGGFRQFIYSDNTAQYSVDTSAELSKKLGQTSTFGLTYRFQQPQGFSPFRFDYVAKYNIANASLNIKESEKFKLSLLSGYNFDQKDFPWQDITLRFSVQPTRSFLFYTATGFDFNRSQWRTLINQIRLRSGNDFRLDIGTRFDPTVSKLATVKTQLDAPVGRLTRLQAAVGYNGLTKSTDYRSLAITRDLHCWEASLVYTDQNGFTTNQSVMLYLRIKAFPVFRQFGVGAFGQALDTSVGQVY